MKKKLFIVAAVGALQLLNCSGNAQELFQASVSAVAISTNETGNLIYKEFGNRDLIKAAAAEQGITNLADLSLVYDRTNDALEVVSGTNDTVIATPLAFANSVYLSNTNGTKVQRLAYVYWETNQTASGTLLAGEQTVEIPPRSGDTNSTTYFTLNGRLQFALSDTNGATIYAGNVSAGPELFHPFPVFPGRQFPAFPGGGFGGFNPHKD